MRAKLQRPGRPDLILVAIDDIHDTQAAPRRTGTF